MTPQQNAGRMADLLYDLEQARAKIETARKAFTDAACRVLADNTEHKRLRARIESMRDAPASTAAWEVAARDVIFCILADNIETKSY